MTKKKTAHEFNLDTFKASNARLKLQHPVTFKEDEDAWIELAPIHSLHGDKAQAAMITQAKLSTAEITKLSEQELIAHRLKRERELAARLVVAWNEDKFGPFSTERVIELFEEYRAIYVQVEFFMNQTRNFYRA
jgi:hypothetical protein